MARWPRLNHAAAALVVGAGLLAACQGPVPPAVPELTFAHLQPIRFDAARVDFVDNYRPPMAAPNVEHIIPTSPATAARAWARARIAADGPTGTVRVTVNDASVVETHLTVRQGLAGAFYDEQDTRYDAAVDVTIEYSGRVGGTLIARAQAKRSRTVPESITLNERNKMFQELMEALMSEFDDQMVKAVRQYMAAAVH